MPAQTPELASRRSAAARVTRPGRLLRRVLRLPILLYRSKLGWLLGHRFLLLTHTGRRTGLARQTVLEVLRFDPDTSTAVVMAGFGRRSDWYQNLQRQPALEVVVSRRAFRPAHRQLTQDEAVSVLADYERRNRLAAPLVRAVLSRLLGWRYDGSDAARRRLAEERPLLALWPDTTPATSDHAARRSSIPVPHRPADTKEEPAMDSWTQHQHGQITIVTGPAVTRTKVRFGSHGVDCAGYLYRPTEATGTLLPCVVLGHGTAGTMDRLFVYAEPFAAAGMAVLLFDYRGWDASDGQPRQVIDIGGQLDDWRAAIDFARGLDDVDPQQVALWGSSLSGGHVVAIAANDPRVAAVVAQVPWFGDPRTPGQILRQLAQPSTLKLSWAGIRDAVRGARGRSPYLVPIVGEPGQTALFTGPEVKAALEAKGVEGSLWRNQFAPRFVFALPRYAPGKLVERLGMPLLVCVADRDRETPAEFAARFVERAPHGELRRYPASHFEIYHGEMFRQVLADQVDFLRRRLVPAAAGRG